jgi:hypothetical protein
MMLNFHYTDDTGISIPLGYEVITKTENVWSEQYQKFVKKSMFTKNEIMRDKLEILHFNNKVKYKYILFDKWFSSLENLVFINDTLKKKFVCSIKSNRKIALTKKDKDKGNYVNISNVDIEACSSRLIYLEGYKDPIKLIKQVVKSSDVIPQRSEDNSGCFSKLSLKDGNDDESVYLYLITNDITLNFQEVLEIYQKWWKIEEYHKSFL